MVGRLFTTALVFGAMLVCGCKERPQAAGTSSSTTRPSTRPAQQNITSVPPATLPATRPAVSHLRINGQAFEFPRARLRIVQREPEIVVRLFSDDPPQALQPSYAGNSFYFEMTLKTNDIEQIASMDWDFKARSMEYLDTPHGVFLDGSRKQLQPYRVHVEFDHAGKDLMVVLRGDFLMFQLKGADVGQAPQMAVVEGVLTVELEGTK